MLIFYNTVYVHYIICFGKLMTKYFGIWRYLLTFLAVLCLCDNDMLIVVTGIHF